MSCCCSPCRTGSSFSRSPGLFGSSFPRASDCAAALCEIWRRRVVALFLDKGLLNHDFARKLLGWNTPGSAASGTRILDQPMREAPCQ